MACLTWRYWNSIISHTPRRVWGWTFLGWSDNQPLVAALGLLLAGGQPGLPGSQLAAGPHLHGRRRQRLPGLHLCRPPRRRRVAQSPAGPGRRAAGLAFHLRRRVHLPPPPALSRKRLRRPPLPSLPTPGHCRVSPSHGHAALHRAGRRGCAPGPALDARWSGERSAHRFEHRCCVGGCGPMWLIANAGGPKVFGAGKRSWSRCACWLTGNHLGCSAVSPASEFWRGCCGWALEAETIESWVDAWKLPCYTWANEK